MKFLYSSLLAASLLASYAHAALETAAPAANSAVASNSMITPDTSIFEKCSFEDLKQTHQVDWVTTNTYEFNKRNMTIANSKKIEEKINQQGERAFMMNRMNDPEFKKTYLEQVGFQLERNKIQDAVYKCVQANIMKNSPEDLKRVISKDSKRASDSIPMKSIAIQMALNKRMVELASDVRNYHNNCNEKEPKDLIFIDNPACQEKFARMTQAQILLGPYSQLRADIDAFSTDDKAFEKTLNANVAYQATLENERNSKTTDAGGTTNATAPAAKPTAVN